MIEIIEDDLQGDEIIDLLTQHLQHMHSITPIESVHALDISELRSPDITLWSAWKKGQLLGCGALKELDARCGEIKSMRTANAYQRTGVASALLEYIIDTARVRHYRSLYLETGSMRQFQAARQFYERAGFTLCAPFADYVEDPNSVFYCLHLD